MHFQFLVEDYSGAVLVEKIMQKLLEEAEFTFEIKSFKGIGGFKGTGSVKDIKTNKLLTDLPQYLRAFDNSLRGIEACVIVVLDNDTRDTQLFEKELEAQAQRAMISIDHVFCIAVEEMEAWLLGDEKALLEAYPFARESKYKEYVQDSICGTWELLADIVFKGGLKRLKKECPTYREIGRYKAEWAEQIGTHIDLSNNKSPSFRYFISALRARIDNIA